MQEEEDAVLLAGLCGALAGMLTANTLPPGGVTAIRSCLERSGDVGNDADVPELVRALGSVATRLSDPLA